MYKFVKNCADVIDWVDLVANLAGPGTPAYIEPDKWAAKKDYNEIAKLWCDADMNFGGVAVSNYEPDRDYPNTVTHAMENLLGLTHVESWISRINPGCMAPYHWDFDNPNLVNLPGPFRRVSGFISEFSFGHVFIVGDDVHYKHSIGDLIEFPDIRAWHAGANLGLVPKYMYHFIGY